MQRIRVVFSHIIIHRFPSLFAKLSSRPTARFDSHASICKPLNAMAFSTIERGSPNTLDYRLYFKGPQGIISPFHDIPLYANEEKTLLNMVVEIPRWTNAKLEINKEEPLNPLKQDVKKGKLRFVKNVFPHHGYIWNYGALPQTWEDPNHTTPETNTKGDMDPLDVCEIGSKVHPRGAIVQVKVLGVMCLIDEGETDWKIITIDANDPLAPQLNDIDDVNSKLPGFVQATNEWFRLYKIPDGKPENKFAFDGKAQNKDYAMKVIGETYSQWEALVTNKVTCSEMSISNTTVESCPQRMSQEQATAIVEKNPPLGPAASFPEDVDKWHYVTV